MTPERYQQIGKLFNAALERPAAERSAWLQQASGSDAELRAEVEKLLANDVESDSFLARPAMEVAAELLVQKQPLTADLAGRQITHYQILSLLGAGGMGQVYLAKDTRLGRQVALKLLPTRFLQSAEHLRRFEREALAASALNHPNILTIYEFGAEADAHFLATEYVQGETLRQRLTRGQLTVAEILAITGQIVAALQAAHEAGIIHRDIKPDNVMVRHDGIVKVLDFGLAKLIEQAQQNDGAVSHQQQSSLTQHGTILGTVAYMSPEQARGQTVDARTDIFSVGVMLYELIAGRQPFTGETVNHTIVAILETEPPPLREATVPAELERILQRMLAKKLEARYPNAATLLTDLKQLAKRLEWETEWQFVSPAAAEREAATQILQLNTNEQLGDATLQLPPSHAAHHFLSDPPREVTAVTTSPSTLASDAVADEVVPVPAPRLTRRKRLLWMGALSVAIVLTGITAYMVWLEQRFNASHPVTLNPGAKLERSLSYFLTVQRYRNDKPFQAEFQSSGREIFEAGWRFKLNISSPQEGFLYLLNEETSGAYVLLFPLPSHNNGASRLVPNERFQTSWYVFDEKPGTEQFRLIWAAQPVLELEALRELMNATDKGRVSDPTQAKAVRNFLQQHATPPIENTRDPQNKQTNVRGTGAVLVALIELEHR